MYELGLIFCYCDSTCHSPHSQTITAINTETYKSVKAAAGSDGISSMCRKYFSTSETY